ncbi:MAG TPA: PTS system mannose/fructose/sorbose family transporter subunit IID [Syntrophales bacterium]|nr:PTS system mannose/fructose/sorbose family transporter subunit IID [Syntrophales bacterium]
MLKRKIPLQIFLRSLLIQGSWNVSRMQGLGFAYAIAPLVSAEGEPGHPATSALLARHLQRFNTHPYLAASIIGSVGRLEAENRFKEAPDLKNALMGPYAAIGDSFFWGALRPFGGIAAVCLAIVGFFLAPLMLLVLYNPVHLWVRIRGFITGWRQGQNAIDFIRRLDLPEMSRRIRWGSTILLAVAAYLASTAGPFHDLLQPGLPGQVGGLLVVLASFLAVRKGISPLAILYGSVTFFAVVMMMR